ncbi:hypothetical protein, conserved [Trypanosoma brucei gambiense DAL972]|uniref:Membrane-trafficking protein n=1 Tax=Trypanosoma brucei gambiense (strain MHOM/CI/86/DAL972) TaxID=679716 RepID=C9ZYI6_TRYB9|nr:hypothetical protein, conserved [Trypanosoma brucei gambiense DAL972]CBH14485.1 hypothetical protein, conserved [Trypanosoma brucei gambiense DAL972]|eukprot:XP_011776751.1 hypothetical protein, conserved [Trypanosoma brucei gambiense DAL972]
MPADSVVGIPADLSLAMVEEKEAELAKRRQEIRRMQGNVASPLGPEPNFPPQFLCIKPLVYHNIKEQVPVPSQRFMYTLAFMYFALIAIIIYNISIALLSFVFGGSGMHFGLSFVYLVGIPGAFVVWYYNVYSSVVSEANSRRWLGYVGLALGVIFDIWMAVGVSGLGGCGWIMALGEKNFLVFILAIISASLWTAHCLMLLLLGIKYFRMASSAKPEAGAPADTAP